MKLTRRDFTAGLAVGISAPYVIGSARAQGATIKIGMCVPVTGPAAEQGLWAQNGAKLALAAVNKAGGVLGKQVELVIEDDQTTDAVGTAGGKALSDALGKLGAPPVLDQGYANQSQDFTPVVLAVKQSGADVLGTYFTFENDLGIFARQLRQLGVNIPWVGSPSVVAVSSTKLAGPALYGTYGVADYAEESSEASKTFGKAYREAYKTAPDNQSAWPYDAVTILSAAINKAGSTDPGKIREALLATKKTPGAEGEYNFDQNGDGLHGYNVVRNEKGTIVYDKHIDFND